MDAGTASRWQLQPLVLELGHTLNAERELPPEEVVAVDAHTVQGQQVGPGIGLPSVPRPFPDRQRPRPGPDGTGQGGGAPIDLCHWGCAAVPSLNEGAWLHVVGKEPGQMPAQVVGVHGFLGHGRRPTVSSPAGPP